MLSFDHIFNDKYVIPLHALQSGRHFLDAKLQPHLQ